MYKILSRFIHGSRAKTENGKGRPFLSHLQKLPKSKHFLTLNSCKKFSMHHTTTFKVFKSFSESLGICRIKRDGRAPGRNGFTDSNVTTTDL